MRGAALETGVQGLTFSVAGMRKTDIFVARSKTVDLGSSVFLNSSWLQWAWALYPDMWFCKGPRASFMKFRGRAPWAQNTELLNAKLGCHENARERCEALHRGGSDILQTLASGSLQNLSFLYTSTTQMRQPLSQSWGEKQPTVCVFIKDSSLCLWPPSTS